MPKTLKSCSNGKKSPNLVTQTAILTVSSISAEKKAITSSRCYKKFGGDLDFPKIKKMKNVCSDIWTCTKLWKLFLSKSTYTLNLFFAFKMAYSCCFSWGGNLDFLDLVQKKIITSTTDCFFQISSKSSTHLKDFFAKHPQIFFFWIRIRIYAVSSFCAPNAHEKIDGEKQQILDVKFSCRNYNTDCCYQLQFLCWH